MDARAATRMLETVFVYTAFYEVSRLLAAGDPSRALAMLEIAAAARPSRPQICWNRARALAQTGDRDGALEALECAVASGQVPVAALESDPYLEPVREDPRYRMLIGRPTAGPEGRQE